MNFCRLIFAEQNPENNIIEMIEASRREISPEILAGEFAARQIFNGSDFMGLESLLYHLQDEGAEFDIQTALEIAELALDEIAEKYAKQGFGVYFSNADQ